MEVEHGPRDPGKAAHPSRRTVLVVDDDADVLASYRQLISSSIPGVEVITASSGEHGIRLLWTRDIDLVVTDLNMPGTSGLEVLAAARLVLPGVPRLLISAAPAVPDFVHIDGLARHCLRKPLDPTQFVSLTKRLLE